MTKRMLIDAAHAEETRVVVVDGSRIEELDFESQSRKQLRGNIYLAKVTRVEPSLQAAFVEYGGNRHGFLSFTEIHPDYYQIPVADREALLREEAEDEDEPPHPHREGEGEDGAALDDDDVMEEELERRRRRLMRRYKIQEVIRRRQIMLVQVVKEERGNKGAALTTYLSLAGRYCVLMPNTARGGGISRKITNAVDRKRLKSAAQSLELPQGMGLIIRTAGAARTKVEIKRDYEYLLRMWENIRETTLQSIAPALIYAEEDLVKRAIRDMYDKDLDGILVEGEAGYREARDFMRMIMPSQAKKIQHYREPTPLFVRHNIEDQLALIHSPTVPLKSGGYIVINQTEALVAVDVNSGRSTRERNVEATALKTNMEAAEETARQLRLRDLAGLIVIDFIDMDEAKNNRSVEKMLKDCLKDDRARVQMGKISSFGLMEISRQRRRSGVLEGTTHICEHCQGQGRVRSVESSSLSALRSIEVEAAKGGAGAITVRLPPAVGLYVLNEKRIYLARLEQTHDLTVTIVTDEALSHADVEVERTESRESAGDRDESSFLAPALSARQPLLPEPDVLDDDLEVDDEAEEDEDEPQARAESRPARRDEGSTELTEDGPRRRRRRRRGRRGDEERGEGVRTNDDRADSRATGPAADSLEGEGSVSEDEEDDGFEDEAAGSTEAYGDGERRPRRRRRGRRGGRRIREEARPQDPYAWVHAHGGAEQPGAAEDPYAWRDPHTAATGGLASSDAEPLAVAPTAEVASSPAQAPVGGQTPDSGAETYVWADGPSADTAEREAGEPEAAAAEPRRDRTRRSRSRRPRGERRDESVEGSAPAEPALADEQSTLEPPAAEAQPLMSETTAPVLEQGPTSEVQDSMVDASEVDQPEAQSEGKALELQEPEGSSDNGADGDSEAATAVTPAIRAVETPPPVTPDPAEISSPPDAPKRGWWRRRG